MTAQSSGSLCARVDLPRRRRGGGVLGGGGFKVCSGLCRLRSGDKKGSVPTGSLSTCRSFRMSLEFVISCSLIFLMIVSNAVGVRIFLFRFLISRDQVIEAPG